MSVLDTILLALVQGITELFPVSSLAHAVILPRLMGWGNLLHNPEFLPFIVVMHLGTAIAMLLYFWRDWSVFMHAILSEQGSGARRLLFLVALATMPAVLLGFGLHTVLTEAFAKPEIVAFVLILNGIVLYIMDSFPGSNTGTLRHLNWKGALFVGFAQSLALMPGFSRSGLTIIAGMLSGLRHEESARFSFLLGPPVILGATVLEARKLIHHGSTLGQVALLSGVTAGVFAYISLAILMRWFHTHEFKALRPFAYYCGIAGLTSLALMHFMKR